MKHIPIIPAVRREEDIPHIETSSSKKIFLMFGEITKLSEIVKTITQMGKDVYLHTDLVKGLSQDKEALSFIAKYIKPTGIVTTKSFVIKNAKLFGLQTIHHLFMIDTNAFESGIKNVRESKPDGVEIMPGLMPQIIKQFITHVDAPVYCGGLVKQKSDIDALIDAGASGVITGDTSLWS